MATMGLGAFTEGLQGGMAARSKRDLTRQYTRRLTDEGDRADWQWDADVATARGKWETDPQNEGIPYTPPTRSKIQDPALLRMMKKFGGRIKGMFGADDTQSASFVSPEIAPSSPVEQQQAAPAPGGFQQGQGIPQQGPMEQPYMADGGIVRYQDGGYVSRNPMSQEWMAGMGGREDMPEVQPGTNVPPLGEQFDDTLRSARAGGEDVSESLYALGQSESAREAGGHFVDVVGHGARTAGATAIGAAKDILVDNPITQFGMGMLGIDGKEQAAGIPAQQETATTPATEDPSTSEAVKAAVDQPDRTDANIAEEAMSEGQQYALENLDYKMLVDQGVRPDDLPSMTTRDWADYRQGLWEREISRGVSAKAALQSVEYATVELQMRGMMRELDKATQYLGFGQNQEAAMAVRQAFQYFPNGSGVRFGTVTDPKTGQPAIMAMGTSEETGESTGAPMIITADRLAALRNQMSNPAAFSAWTKDGHDLQMQVAKLQETQKHNVAMEDIYATNAATSQLRAQAGAEGGGFSASELRQREGVYRDQIANDIELTLDQPEHARSLARAMSKLESMYPGIDQNAVIDEIYRAYDADRKNMSGVEALINPQAQQTGIPEG